MADLKDDPFVRLTEYELRHLVGHLAAAERGEDLHRLLRLEWVQTEEVPYLRPGLPGWWDRVRGKRHCEIKQRRHNAWYEAQSRAGQSSGYLADIARAWQVAEESFLNLQSPTSIGLQCRYALITASFNSLAKNVPPALLSVLVLRGVWSPAQGLAYARRTPDPKDRAQALTSLMAHLPKPDQGHAFREALAASLNIGDAQSQAEALAALALRLAELGYAGEALATVQKMRDQKEADKALAGVAFRLAKAGHPEQALTSAQRIQDTKEQTKALAGLAPQFAELGCLDRLLSVIWDIAWEEQRANALARVASYLAGAERERALREALRVALETSWVDQVTITILADLAPNLPEAEREQVLRKALTTARNIEAENYQAEALVKLAPCLPEPLLREALTVVLKIERESYRVEGLAGLVPYLSEPLLCEALSAARTIQSEQYRADALARMAAHLPDSLLREALSAAWDIEDAEPRAMVLSKLACYLPRPEQEQALRGALASARSIESPLGRLEALVKVVPQLSEAQRKRALQEALLVVRKVGPESSRPQALSELAPYMPQPLLREALTLALEIDWWHDRAQTLAGLAPYMSEPLQREALAATQGLSVINLMGGNLPRKMALAELAPYLAGALLLDALAAAGALDDGAYAARTLARLAPHLPETLLPQAADAARNTYWEPCWERDFTALVKLALRLVELRGLNEALALIRETASSAEDRVTVLANLIPRLTEPERGQVVLEALGAVRNIDDKGLVAEALVKLGPLLPESLIPRVLAMAQRLPDGDRFERSPRNEALAGLASYLPEPAKQQIIQHIMVEAPRLSNNASTGHSPRVDVLTRVAPCLPTDEREQVLREALASVPDIQVMRNRVETLIEIARYLPEPLLKEALSIGLGVEEEYYRAQALAGLARYLPKTLLEEAMAAALAMRNKRHLARALAGLAPQLPISEQDEVFRKALVAAREIDDYGYRVEVLAELAPRLAALPCGYLYGLWREALPVLTARSRLDLLSDLGLLEPVIFALGGRDAVVETFHAIQDVVHWWS